MPDIDVKDLTNKELRYFCDNHQKIVDAASRELASRIVIPQDIIDEFVALRKKKKMKVQLPCEVEITMHVYGSTVAPNYRADHDSIFTNKAFDDYYKDFVNRVNEFRDKVESLAKQQSVEVRKIYDILYNRNKNA